MNTTQITSTPTVLVIDDDDFSQAALCMTLVALGLTQFEVAADGRGALRVFDQMQPAPDYLICDIYMPDMDGVEFLLEMHHRAYKGGIVLVSGDPSILHIAQKIAKAHHLNILGAFSKPLTREALAQALGMAVP